MFLTSPSVLVLFLFCFFVSATPLKRLNRISWKFVVIKDIMCRCGYLQEILIQFLFLRVTLLLNLEIWAKWKILLKQFVSTTPLKPLNRISVNFVIMKDILSRCAYPQEILFIFFSPIYALELRYLTMQNERYYWNSLSASLTPLKSLNRISWNFVVNEGLNV